MPGFARVDFRSLTREPTEAELEEMRRDGMNPLTGQALRDALAKSGPPKDAGIDMTQFVPAAYVERYMRMRQANFNGFEFDRLGDMRYDTMVLERWYKRAETKAEDKWHEDHKDG